MNDKELEEKIIVNLLDRIQHKRMRYELKYFKAPEYLILPNWAYDIILEKYKKDYCIVDEIGNQYMLFGMKILHTVAKTRICEIEVI